MKRFVITGLFLFTVVFIYSQGTENFANFPETGNSYQDGTFTGQDGSTWTYWQCRGDMTINPPTPCLGKDRTPTAEVISGLISGGCGTLSFDYMQAFSTNVNLDVFVNGLLVTTVTSSSQQSVILNSGPVTVNASGDFTLDFKQKNTSSGQVSIDNITWTGYGGGPLPEPTNYPTAFSALPAPFQITLEWTDATGGQVPTAYLIKASSTNNIINPVDGNPVPDDPDLSDGSAVLNIIQGAQNCLFTGLPGNSTYYFKIFPYTNSGSNIDFKTDGTPPSAQGLTPNIIIINSENFNDLSLGTWTPHNIVGPQQFWMIDTIHGTSGSPCAKMNGYSGGAVENEDWLISPAMNFDDYSNEELTFMTAMNYSGPELEVKISNDYGGTGDPNDYEWTDLDAIFSPGGWAWTSSGYVDVSGVSGSAVYIAFKYTSTTSQASTWELDDILVLGEIYIGVSEPDQTVPVFSFYPNPANDIIHIMSASQSKKTFQIISLLGTEVFTTVTSAPEIQVDCSQYPQGIYFIRIQYSDRTQQVKKLIIQ